MSAGDAAVGVPARIDLPGGRALRPFADADAAALVELVRANQSRLQRWMPWATADYGLPQAVSFISEARAGIAERRGCALAIVAGERLVGTCGIARMDPVNRAASIGYWLAEEEQGRGTATAAAGALVDLLLDDWGLHRIELRAAVDNERSRAVAVRLGFRVEGVARESERHGERYVDHVVHALVAGDARPTRAVTPS